MKHVLFASDFSQASEQAFDKLLEIAGTLQCRVTILSDYALMSSSQLGEMDLSEASLQSLEDNLKARIQGKQQLLKERLEQVGVQAQVLLKRGHIGKLIIETARQQRVDLIVMGSRGLDELDAFLFSSTSTFVLHNSPCPVLILPAA